MIPKSLSDGLEYDPIKGTFTRSGRLLCRGTSAAYPTVRYLSKAYKAHVLAWFFYYGKWPSMQLDHIDRNKYNFAISNLREVDTSTNCHNQFGSRRSNRLTKMQGVKIHRRQSGTIVYRAAICIDGKDVHLGLFNTPEEAHNAYMKKKLEHIGEQVNLSNIS